MHHVEFAMETTYRCFVLLNTRKNGILSQPVGKELAFD